MTNLEAPSDALYSKEERTSTIDRPIIGGPINVASGKVKQDLVAVLEHEKLEIR
jgi:hypothetical protein